jgi:hypothetical protein
MVVEPKVTRATRRVLSMVGLAIVCAGSFPSAQDDVFPLVMRMGAYVETFQRDFGSMVAEERYEQNVRRVLSATTRSSRGGPESTVLRSDFLLVRVPGEGWLPFRDVFERDGKKIGDRDERLADLFLKGDRSAVEQAAKIMAEGARYNIGNVDRNINLPTLPVTFLTPAHRTRFTFELGKPEDDGIAVVEYNETARPTYVRTTGGRDLPVYGRYWVEAKTGTIRRTELHAVDTGVEAHITVTYQPDPATGLWVPARMDERYRRPRDSWEVVGAATYSRFRKFQVSTTEEVATEGVRRSGEDTRSEDDKH